MIWPIFVYMGHVPTLVECELTCAACQLFPFTMLRHVTNLHHDSIFISPLQSCTDTNNSRVKIKARKMSHLVCSEVKAPVMQQSDQDTGNTDGSLGGSDLSSVSSQQWPELQCIIFHQLIGFSQSQWAEAHCLQLLLRCDLLLLQKLHNQLVLIPTPHIPTFWVKTPPAQRPVCYFLLWFMHKTSGTFGYVQAEATCGWVFGKDQVFRC